MTLTVIEGAFLMHKSGDRILRAVTVKHVTFGVLRVETIGPETLKVDCICQNQVGVLAVRRQEIADVAFGHIADPIIDLVPHCAGICIEIGYLQLIAEQIEHTLAHLRGVCNPKSSGDSIVVRVRRPTYLK